MPSLCRHLAIHGRVQGVGYRRALCGEAAALGLRGWVRNRRDGSVEALLEGSPEAVAALTNWAQRGPPAALVDRVVVTDQAAGEPLSGFAQRPTL